MIGSILGAALAFAQPAEDPLAVYHSAVAALVAQDEVPETLHALVFTHEGEGLEARFTPMPGGEGVGTWALLNANNDTATIESLNPEGASYISPPTELLAEGQDIAFSHQAGGILYYTLKADTFTLHAMGSEVELAPYITGIAEINAASGQFTRVRFIGDDFKPHPAARFSHFDFDVHMDTPWPGGPQLITYQKIHIQGRAMFQSFDSLQEGLNRDVIPINQ